MQQHCRDGYLPANVVRSVVKFPILLLFIFVLLTVPAYAQENATLEAAGANVDAGIAQLRNEIGGDVRVSKSRATGVANFVRLGEDANLATIQREGGTPEAQAGNFFNRYGSIFGIRDANAELRLTETLVDNLNGRHLIYQQLYQDVEIFAGE